MYLFNMNNPHKIIAISHIAKLDLAKTHAFYTDWMTNTKSTNKHKI